MADVRWLKTAEVADHARSAWLARQTGDWVIYSDGGGFADLETRRLHCRACDTVVPVPFLLTVNRAQELMQCRCVEEKKQHDAWREHFGVLCELADV